MTKKLTNHVLALVRAEREAQDEKWGTQRHGMTVWGAVLAEEVGEASAEVLKLRATPLDSHQDRVAALFALREELTQVAAVSVAWLEHVCDALQNGDDLPSEVWQ